jgi:hypothetical protein
VQPHVPHLEASVPDRRAVDQRVIRELLLRDREADRPHVGHLHEAVAVLGHRRIDGQGDHLRGRRRSSGVVDRDIEREGRVVRQRIDDGFQQTV